MAKKSRKELKLGILLVVGLVISALGINYLKGNGLLTSNRVFYSVYNRVDGLGTSNPIILNGFKIGSVRKIELLPDNNAKLKVTYVIEEGDLIIPDDTEAEIISSDLLGSKAVKLNLGRSSTLAEEGGQLAGTIEMDLAQTLKNELEPIKNRTSDLIKSIDSFISNAQKVFEDEGTQDIPLMFESMARTVKSLESSAGQVNSLLIETRPKLNSTLSNVEELTSTLADSSSRITETLQNFNTLSDSLAAIKWTLLVNNLESTTDALSQLLEGIDKGEGTLGKLAKSDSLHTQLNLTLREIELLANDLQQNPKRYINFSLRSKEDRDGFSKKELEEMNEAIEKRLKDK